MNFSRSSQNFQTSNPSQIKKYTTNENFSTFFSWSLMFIILLIIALVILSIVYLFKMTSSTNQIIKNKDKNQEIIENIILT